MSHDGDSLLAARDGILQAPPPEIYDIPLQLSVRRTPLSAKVRTGSLASLGNLSPHAEMSRPSALVLPADEPPRHKSVISVTPAMHTMRRPQHGTIAETKTEAKAPFRSPSPDCAPTNGSPQAATRSHVRRRTSLIHGGIGGETRLIEGAVIPAVFPGNTTFIGDPTAD